MINKKLILIAIAIIILVSFFAMMPTLSGNFVNWDDPAYVTQNIDIFNLSFNNIKKIFSSFYCGTYAPLTVFSFAVEYYFVQLNPFLYHLDNLILHLANTSFVFWFIFLLFQSKKNVNCKKLLNTEKSILIASFVALLFGIHPLHVESVAWITERKDTLYAFFYLGALIAYVKYLKLKIKLHPPNPLQKRTKSKILILCFLLFCCSLLSKSMAITLPVVMILLDFFFHRKISFKMFFEKIPFFVCSIIIGVIAIAGQKVSVENDSFSINFNIVSTAIYELIFYIYKAILPLNLACIYDRLPATFSELFVFVGLLIAIIISLRFTRILFFGSLFYFITIMPTLPDMGVSNLGDRFFYIPSIGIFLIFAIILLWFWQKFAKVVLCKIIFCVALAAFLVFLFFTTFKQCKNWQDSITLWSKTIEVTPRSYHSVLNRGSELFRRGDVSNAVSDLIKATRINPVDDNSFVNRGVAFMILKNYTNAIDDFNEAIKFNPKNAGAYFNRAAVQRKQGNYTNAFNDLTIALSINKTYLKALKVRGIVALKLKKYETAIQDFSKVIIIEPKNSANYYRRAQVYIQCKKIDKALTDFSQCIKYKPDNRDLYFQRGLLYLQNKESNKANNDFNTAKKLGYKNLLIK